MATERSQHQQWYDREVATLVELGVDLADAEKRQQWILDNMPPWADPDTYVFVGRELYQEPATPENEQDSRVAYIANEDTPNRFKRLPSAKIED